MSDLFENHIVCFPTRRLNYVLGIGYNIGTLNSHDQKTHDPGILRFLILALIQSIPAQFQGQGLISAYDIFTSCNVTKFQVYSVSQVIHNIHV